MPQEMTVSEVLVDPLIRLVLDADRVSVASLATLLDDAARRQSPRPAGSDRPGRQASKRPVDAPRSCHA